MAAYRRVYDSCHLQADCQEAAAAPEPSVIDYGLPLTSCICALADFRGGADTPPPGGRANVRSGDGPERLHTSLLLGPLVRSARWFSVDPRLERDRCTCF